MCLGSALAESIVAAHVAVAVGAYLPAAAGVVASAASAASAGVTVTDAAVVAVVGAAGDIDQVVESVGREICL